jgi:dolichol-phosphate mannosyltransferase
MSSHAQALSIVAPVTPRELPSVLETVLIREPDYQQLTVIIPTLNEAGNIGELLDELVERYPGIQVLVADDDSTDNTREEVMARTHLHPQIGLLWRRGRVRGLTVSVLDALDLVSTEYFAVMDGDLQHPPETIEKLLSAVLKGSPLAVATRDRFRVAPHRWLISKVATLMGRLRLWWSGAASCTDCMSGYFAGRTALFRRVALQRAEGFEAQGYKVLFDLLKQSPRHIPVAEVAYEFDPRQRGQSKISTQIMWIYLRSLFH